MKALLLVDIQIGLDELDYYGGARNNVNAESNCRKLLDYFRKRNLPIFHIKHNSTKPASPLHHTKPGNAIKSIVQPLETEPLIQRSNSTLNIRATRKNWRSVWSLNCAKNPSRNGNLILSKKRLKISK